MATKPPASTADASTDASKAKQSETNEYTVAPGRSVQADRVYGPDEKVTLPADEGKKLQRLGFLRLDDGGLAGVDGGPATVKGAEIKES